MSQPEYIVQDSEKTVLTENQLANIVQTLLDLEVDGRVLSEELSTLVSMSARITGSIRELRQLLLEQE